jgi:hypothetical protein
MSGLITLLHPKKTNLTKKRRVPIRYLPKQLTRKDRNKQRSYLIHSRRSYKKGVYYTRPRVKSFKNRPSPHVARATKMYHVENMKPSAKLARATGCSISGLRKIVRKGEGAYYSSGSRPNQTAKSWGYARLGSALTGQNAAIVDYSILENHCKPGSRPLRLAKKLVHNRKSV